jgi:signal transduction histidine kinase/ligand-binding sensor domain-containing protein
MPLTRPSPSPAVRIGPLPFPRAPIWLSAALPLLLSALPETSRAASVDLHYRVWTIEEGLPQGSVRAITQTFDGYLWIGTFDGLVRFDGVRMTVFSKSDYAEMTSNRCLSLLVDRRGTLWIGTEDGGVMQMQGGRFRAVGRSAGLPSETIHALAEDDNGQIWAATGAGPAVFAGDRWTLHEGRSIFSDAQAMLASLSVPQVTSYTRRLQDQPLWTKGAGGRIWLLDGGHVHRREGNTWHTFANPIPSQILPTLTAIFEDREGALWIGSERGLTQATPTVVRVLVPPGTVDDINVYVLSQDAGGRVWVGTQRNPLMWHQHSFTTLPAAPWWPLTGATAIEPEADGALLAGGPQGVYRIRPGRSFEKLRDDPTPLDLARDRTGTLWVAGMTGLFRQSTAGWDRIEGLPSDDVKVLLESRDGAMWIGTYGGLARLAGTELRSWTTANGLSSDRIRALHEDDAGTLWIGTYDGGLNRFDGRTFVPIKKRDGLYDDGVFAILDGGDGRFYMCSNRGIHAVARRDLDAFAAGTTRHVTHRAWRSADGMPSSECNGGRQPAGFRAADGTLWFPTQRGIAIIDPRDATDNPTPPLLAIEEVATERRTIPPGARITLRPGERRLRVRYTGNTFVRPEGARFRYRLEGYDEDWVEAGNGRVAEYSYIPPGQYVLTIHAANSDGVWTPQGVSLPIGVDPYWWQTAWFRYAAVALGLGLLGAVYQQRVSSLKRRRAEQDAFAHQLLDSQEAERKRIASELHDGIGQTLVLIRNRAMLGLRTAGEPAVQQELDQISAVARDGIEEVRKIARGLRPYQLDRLGLTRALETLVEQTAAAAGIPIAARIGELSGLVAKDDEINVYRIVQEGVSNMVQHARAASGRVSVEVQGREIEIRVEDDGSGFDPTTLAAAGSGLGLTGIAERARILGGRSTVRSSPGQGTCVIVQIPVRGPAV